MKMRIHYREKDTFICPRSGIDIRNEIHILLWDRGTLYLIIMTRKCWIKA